MKQGWEIKKLVDICDKASSNVSQNQLTNETGNYPIYGAGGLIKNISFYHRDKEYISIVKDGAGIGRTTLLPANSSVIGTLQYLMPKKNIDIRFLYYFLLGIDFLKHKNGSTIPHIYFKDYSQEQIAVPNLETQQQIVAILDQAFATIDQAKTNAQKNLQNAKELFESSLQIIFTNKGKGWEEKSLEDICEISSKLIDPKLKEFQNLIHIGAGNIESKKGTLVDLKTAKEENLISGKFLFDKTMVLYSKIRPYLIKVVKCDFEGLCSADIYPLVPLKNVMTKDFLYYLLITKDFTDYAIKGSQRAGMPKVNRNHLFAYKLNLPPLKEQQTLVTKLDALQIETNKLEAIYTQKIADLDELKKSILQKAFAGELKVNA